jgi:transmembrane sensor
MNKQEERFYQLLFRKFNGEITEEETAQLTDMLKAYPELSGSFATAQWLWEQANVASSRRTTEQSNRLLERHLKRLQEATQDEAPVLDPVLEEEFPTSTPKKRYWAAAGMGGITLCLTILAIYIYKAGNTAKCANQEPPNVVMTRPGSKSKLILPDGTTVWLNASSKLSYSNDFLRKGRHVHLDGEAYFEVAPNADHPFIINTDVMNVKVLGTAFNLRAYAGDKEAEAVLISGKIEVQVTRRPDERYLLRPFEKIAVLDKKVMIINGIKQKKAEKSLVISSINFFDKDSTVAETAWIDNKLIFNGEPLSDLATRMERWFGTHITVKDSSLQNFKVSGSFKNESLEDALKAISLITGCKYRLEEHQATLQY